MYTRVYHTHPLYRHVRIAPPAYCKFDAFNHACPVLCLVRWLITTVTHVTQPIPRYQWSVQYSHNPVPTVVIVATSSAASSTIGVRNVYALHAVLGACKVACMLSDPCDAFGDGSFLSLQ